MTDDEAGEVWMEASTSQQRSESFLKEFTSPFPLYSRLRTPNEERAKKGPASAFLVYLIKMTLRPLHKSQQGTRPRSS